MVEPIDIEEVRALCEAATPGPWFCNHVWGGTVMPHDAPRSRGWIALEIHHKPDMELIAQSRTLLPRLGDEIERLRAELDKFHRITGAEMVKCPACGNRWMVPRKAFGYPIFDCPACKAAEVAKEKDNGDS